ncbi:MAG TPA: DNA polymerase III subunit beta [Ruminococcaceae bacterium]|nr:DNA polymerase III subunit beta [Oscillospiraceae bacterium]
MLHLPKGLTTLKIYCDTALLSEACQNVQRAVSGKTTIPAIEGILIKALGSELLLTGYDLEMGITTSIPCKVVEQGAIILNARVLCDIVRKIPGETVYIESDERMLTTIRGGEASYSLIGIDGNEFPELPTVSGGYPVVVSQSLLKNMIRQTIFSVAVKDSKIIHTGVKFEISSNLFRLVAVDGSRLAMRTEEIDYTGEELSFVVPAKTLNEVTKLLGDDEDTVSLAVGKRHIIFEIGNYMIISRLLDGEFLNYKNAIPTTFTSTAIINVDEMIDSIDRASLIITDKFVSPVRFIFDEQLVRISSVTALGTANDSFPCRLEGQKVEIGFNNKLMMDALRACDVDEVKIELNGGFAPIVILPKEGESFLFLILPMRFKKD